MRRPLALLLLGVFMASPAAAGPIRESLQRADVPAEAESPRETEGASGEKLRFWGLTLVAAGLTVATTSIVVSESTDEACAAGLPGARCGLYRFGKAVPWIGAGMSVAGGALLLVGSRRQGPAIVVAAGEVRATMSLTF